MNGLKRMKEDVGMKQMHGMNNGMRNERNQWNEWIGEGMNTMYGNIGTIETIGTE